MADPAPRQRRGPVGYRFRPTEEELVGHYLRHKLMADDPLIYNTIPEIDVCKHEPWDIFDWAASVIPGADPDDSECYFFSPRDYKYSKTNSFRLKRTTSLGYWKVTGRKRQIRDRGTNNVIGEKNNLVFYQGRFPRGERSNWVIHEYHDAVFSPEKGIYVLCKLIKKREKKGGGKSIDSEHESIHEEDSPNNNIIIEHENQGNLYTLSKEPYLSNMNLMISVSSRPILEATEGITQVFSHPKEDQVTQVSFQPKKGQVIQISSQPKEATNQVTQVSSQPKEVTNQVTQISSQPKEVTNQVTQISSQPKETIYPITHISSQREEVTNLMIGTSSQSNQVIDSIQGLSPSNEGISPMLDSTFDFDSEEFCYSIFLMLNPTTDEQGLWEMPASSYMLY